MRREGYELQVSEPKVIYKEIDNKKAEPIEVLTIDTPSKYVGKIIELVSHRKGQLIKMENKGS